MRYPFLHYLGGFLWWFFVKFCKTDLDNEQAEDKRIRNILFTLILGIIATFISVKFF
ncbi:MAG: hypothetical protein ABI554_14335 [Flavobacterium sp.]